MGGGGLMLSEPVFRSSLQHVSLCVCVSKRGRDVSKGFARPPQLQHSDAAVVGVCFKAS